VGLALASYADRPDLVARAEALVGGGWPAFMAADPVEARHWPTLAAAAPDLQVVVLDEERDEPLAVANGVPFAWDGDERSLPEEGWDAALTSGAATARAGDATTTACALSVTVAPEARGAGLSRVALQGLRAAAAARGCRDLVAPLRPSGKCHHPLVPLAAYLGWRDAAGRPHDPWLRTHRALGATVAGICPRSMTIPGSVADWEGWTGLRFRRSGDHVVPHALVPVAIDLERGTGCYVEPNVWVRHDLGGAPTAP
jgi:GNAT superfamily N-acetyltransferase